MKIAIIPARGGSKRIPKKNIKAFYGRPIIAYSIEAAKKSGLFDKIIVSTDCDEIARIAIAEGAEVPFKRPDTLADDVSTSMEVVAHALNWYRKRGITVSYACMIYATAPFIKPDFIRNSFKKLRKNNYDAVFGVTTYAFSIFRSLKIKRSGFLKELWAEHEASRSNDLEEIYHDAGQFYWLANKGLRPKFLIERKIYSSKVVPFIIPRYLVNDIDNPEDWIVAEMMYRICKERRIL